MTHECKGGLTADELNWTSWPSYTPRYWSGASASRSWLTTTVRELQFSSVQFSTSALNPSSLCFCYTTVDGRWKVTAWQVRATKDEDEELRRQNAMRQMETHRREKPSWGFLQHEIRGRVAGEELRFTNDTIMIHSASSLCRLFSFGCRFSSKP